MERIAKGQVLKMADILPMKAGHTISKAIADQWVFFSLAAGTDVSAETFYEDKMFICFEGEALVAGERLTAGDVLMVPAGTALGIQTPEEQGAYLLEGTWEGVQNMNLDYGKILQLKDQIDYVDGSISNVDLAHNAGMKFALLAFDKGQGLTPHTAPGDALIMALEGKARVTMGDVTAELNEGDQFVFQKGVPHSVQALERFKMAILLVL